MANSFWKVRKGIALIPTDSGANPAVADPTDNVEGSLWVFGSSVKSYVNGAVRIIATLDQTQALTNKTIDATLNTISKIADSNIASNAAIALTKLAAVTASKVLVSDTNGNMAASSVTSTTLAFLDATSSIQSQLNGKEPTVSKGNLSETTSSVLTITGGTGAVIGSGVTVQVAKADTSTSGYVSSTDWNTFYNKQPAGSYITASSSDALTNKTIDATLNTISKIADGNIASNAAIALTKLATVTASKVLVSDTSGNIAASSITTTTLAFLDATSSIQSQLNGKQASGAYITASSSDALTNKTIDATLNTVSKLADGNIAVTAAIALGKLAALTASKALVSDASGVISASTITATELGRLSGIGSTADGINDSTVLTNKTLTSPAINGANITMSAASNTNKITVPTGTTAALTALTRVAGNIYYSTSDSKYYGDNGAALVDMGAGGSGITQLTSDVTAGPGSGSVAATIANSAVTNAKMANMPALTFKGNSSTNNALAPQDLTTQQLRDFSGNSYSSYYRNYITNPFGEVDTTGWIVYSDNASVTVVNGNANIQITSTLGWYVNMPVMFTASVLPVNISSATTYYVISFIAGTSFQISATLGGTAITPGSTGSSVFVQTQTPADGLNGFPNITWTRNLSNALINNKFTTGGGAYDLLLTKDAVNRQGEGVSYAFGLCDADRIGQSFGITFNAKVFSGTYTNGDLKVYATLGGSLLNGGNPIVSINASSTVSTPHSASVYVPIVNGAVNFIIHNTSTNATAYAVQFSDFQFTNDPYKTLNLSNDTDWAAYTPTFQGFGTPTAIQMQWRRQGSDIKIRGNFTIGTPTAAEARVSLPSGLTSSDISVIPALQQAGVFAHYAGATAYEVALIEPSVTYLTFGLSFSTVNPITKQNGNIVGTVGNVFSINASVPIQGWTATSPNIVTPAKNSASDWVSYTPTLVGFGTPSLSEFQWRQSGSDIEIRGKFTSGTSTATEARIPFPNSLISAGTSIIPSIQQCGVAILSTAVAANYCIIIEPSVGYMTIGFQSSGAGGLTKEPANGIMSSGVSMSFFAKVPIAGWSSYSQFLAAVPIQKTSYIKDVKAQNTAGGTFTSGAWRTRDLNVINENGSITNGTCTFASLSANQFTLQPGTYRINASAPAYAVQNNQSKLYNITTSADVTLGSNEYSPASGTACRSLITTTITLGTANTFEVRHYGTATGTTNGFGLVMNIGLESYTNIEIIKVA